MVAPCAIIIPALDRRDLTAACIASVRGNTRKPYTLVLVDNGSTEDMSGLGADVVVRHETNLGFAKGCNSGAAAVPDAPMYVFLNNDTEASAGWLSGLRAALRQPRVGIAGSYLHYPGGAPQHSGITFIQSPPLTAVNMEDGSAPPGYVPAVTGAAMAVSRQTWNVLDGFDERYWNGYEDVDLCLRAAELGIKTYFTPDSQLMHHVSASGPERFSAVGENMERLRHRFGHLAEVTDRTTAILIPAMRAQRIAGVLDNIAETTPEPHRVYVMATGGSECHLYAQAWRGTAVVYADDGDTWGHRLNYLFRRTDEPYLFCAADDVLFHDGWLAQAHAALGTMHGVCSVNDLTSISGRGTLPLISRQYIDQFSGCFDVPDVIIFPGYDHNYSETELYETAIRRGRFIYAERSHVEHQHWLVGKSAHDEVYERGQRNLSHDEHLFNERADRLWRR